MLRTPSGLVRNRHHILLHSSSFLQSRTVSSATTPSAESAKQKLQQQQTRQQSTTTSKGKATTTGTTTAFREMNVTRHNFESCFIDLKKDIESPTCRFIAIDTEFTGLSPNEDEKERFLDTLEERYKKVKRAGESFLITQFGLSTVHLNDNDQFAIKTWNFYVFPRPYGSSDERFLCQASSLQFLSDHGFDFNKFIADGIPFINLSKTKTLKKRLQRRIDTLTKPNKNFTLSSEGEEFQAEVHAKLDAWIADGAKNGSKLVIPTKNSFYTMIVHETVRNKASYLYSVSVDGGVEVSYVSKKIKQELIAAKVKEMEDELEQAIGFSKVIETISASKKPVVGHNALLDFVYVFNQFYKPLPPTLAEFKKELVELFPLIYDTKHITLRSPLSEKLQSTGLSSLFEYMRENVKPTPENLLAQDERFAAYREALKAESDGKENLLCHEAGFDALMTGVCFLGLLAHDTNGELLECPTAGNYTARLRQRLLELEPFKNQLNLMISDERFLDLTDLTQKIDRSRVYRVSTEMNSKRKIGQVRMEDVFQSSKIQRVVRENDQEAFVVLSEPSDDVTVNKTATEMGLSIIPYEQYVTGLAEQAKKAEEDEKEKLFEQFKLMHPQHPVATNNGTLAANDSASLWSRCVIS